MYLAVIFCGLFVVGLTSAQVGFAGGYAGTGVGFNPAFMQPFPNLIPPLMIPPIPMPYGPLVPGVGIGAGQTVVSRFGDGVSGGGQTVVSRFGDGVSGGGQTVVSRFGDGVSSGQSVVSGYGSGTGGSVVSGFGGGTGQSVVSGFGGGTGQTVVSRFGDGETTTYVSGPQGSYTYKTSPQHPNTQVFHHPGGQTVINSRFNDDGSQAVHSSHTSTYVAPGSGGASQSVYTKSNSGSFAPQSVNSRGAYTDIDVQPIPESRGSAVSGGSTQAVHGSGYPSNYGSTSSFVSSSNGNGQGHHETISSVNNNGHVQTYRQSSGK